MNLIQSARTLALIGLLAACAERELILEGERLDLRTPLDGSATAEPVAVNRTVPITLPAQVNHTAWTHRSGSPQHRITHPALGTSLTPVWSSSIGEGDNRKHRITADPVVADGRIFTLDSRARVSAHSTAGAALWASDLTPASDKADDASGGGLAIGAGRLFVTTGFGELNALDPATGAVIWTQDLAAATTGAPTVVGNLVYVVSRDSRAWAVDVSNGRVAWELPGLPSPSVMVGGAGPAVTDRLAIFPFGSGELVATFRNGGVRLWDTVISGQRRGYVYTSVTDITSDPVVSGDVIYVGNQSGRVMALNASNGERIWTANDGAYSPVWPVGGSVFLVSDQAQLVRLDAATGERIWGVEMPYFVNDKPKRHKAVYAHYGPVLAGGRLIVGSSDGVLRSFDPASGDLISTVELPGGATTNPVVVNGTLYIVSTKGQLHAFR